jgi:hypothetical protein
MVAAEVERSQRGVAGQRLRADVIQCERISAYAKVGGYPIKANDPVLK